ncbi:hypothetical protein V500_03906 [Pseudogymnoascus sp. VKM F-4518 (FW-2643)]|nr:hypothetical protein V500_03906 [Pseudogymnoascus sp. VKM F-4518 (FW-2643)]
MKSGILSRFIGGKDVEPMAPLPDAVDCEVASPSEKTEKVLTPTQEGEPSSDNEVPSEIAAEGVKKVEAIVLVWTKKELYAAYSCIFLVFFVNSLQQQITSNLLPYVMSDFSSHSLIPVTGIVSQILGGVLKLPIAQLINIWGRPQGLIVMATFCTIGLILMSVCNNVQTYAAAQCFYWVGYNGIGFVLDVFIADTSNLRNRALAFAFSTAPYIVTTWAGPKAADSFYQNSTWRWAFGCFSIVTPIVILPLLYILFSNQRKAARVGLIQKRDSGRTLRESLWHYFIEFDVIGILLISAGFALFLLPFSLAGSQTDKWAAASTITMLVLGVALLIAFGLYEKYLSPRSFIPFHLITNRTVIGACGLSAVSFASFYLWDNYYISYLQVVHQLSITNAGYVFNIFSIGCSFWALVVAAAIHYTGRIKPLALYFGAPLNPLGVGLMIHFRQPAHHIGYVVMCQIFIAFSRGTLVICEEMAAMAAVKQTDVAATLAVLGLSSAVGAAIGSSMAGAIWTNTLPDALAAILPEAEKARAGEIYGSLKEQLEFEWGSEARMAIVQAYGIAQKRMTIASTSVVVLMFVCIIVWKDYRVKDMKKSKGMLF